MKKALRVLLLQAAAVAVAFNAAAAAEAPRQWRPKARLCGFNLLGMFCKTKMAAVACGRKWFRDNYFAFGLLDSGRDDCELEDFEGHKLDRAMLNLLLKYK